MLTPPRPSPNSGGGSFLVKCFIFFLAQVLSRRRHLCLFMIGSLQTSVKPINDNLLSRLRKSEDLPAFLSHK